MSGTSIIKNPKILVGETVRSTAVGTLRISHQGTVADSHMGPEKNETGQYSVSAIIWVLGVVGAANYNP